MTVSGRTRTRCRRQSVQQRRAGGQSLVPAAEAGPLARGAGQDRPLVPQQDVLRDEIAVPAQQDPEGREQERRNLKHAERIAD